MKTLDVVQGTAPWLAARAQHDCASDAPAMMGDSKYVTRNDLIKQRATGIVPEIGASTQRLFDSGHASEAGIRAHAESIVGEDLYPAVGVSGALLASFDGITMDEGTIWEHKLWSEGLANQVRAGAIEPAYFWQVEHQLLVSGANRCLFMTSDGTPERCVWFWYTSTQGRREALLNGWAQFRLDVQAYTPSAPAEVVLAEAQEGLPAVAVRMDGSIAVISNLDLFGERLKLFIDGIKKKPDTDQEFANCEAAVKTLKKAEDALEAAEASALAQIDPVEAMRRTVANYRDTARTTRLLLEKVVKTRKDEIRVEIQQKAVAGWNAHVATINARLKRVRITAAAPDFASAMKGLKTLDSLRGKVDDLTAKAKIAANQEAEDMAKSLAIVDEIAKDHAFLVRDLQDLVTINPEHLAGVLRGRIAEHDASVKAAAEKAAEAAREAIREEERAKAKAEAAAATLPTPDPVVAPNAPQPARVSESRPAAAPSAAGSPARVASKPWKPTDEAIVETLASSYMVSRPIVVGWLQQMNFESLKEAA